MWLLLLCAVTVLASVPPGPGPFTQTFLAQPVPGAPRGVSPDGWKTGKLCDVTQSPYDCKPGKNCTLAIQQAIDDCGDLASGGTVLFPKGSGNFTTAPLWLRSNLTLRVEAGAAIVGTGVEGDTPLAYVRRECVMMEAYAGFLNAGRCLKKKDPLVGWDDCAEWSKMTNIVLEGGGTIDANSESWTKKGGRERPMMVDLMWVDGLTIRDLKIRRPGFWTIHPTFCNNVRIENNDVYTRGANTDGCDPDSAWNVYIGDNTFDTGDDCIAIKSGRDWSGIMVNISTQNVFALNNVFKQGHGVSIGSETSGWVRNVTIRNSFCHGTATGVRVKSCRGRGGGVENVEYCNMTGSVGRAVQLTLNYQKVDPTNVTATPTLRNILIKDVNLGADSDYLQCDGISDSPISGIRMENVKVTNSAKTDCSYCHGTAQSVVPSACFEKP